MKISTQYLVSLLSCIEEMPDRGFLPDALAEYWQSSGRQLDDRFILHYEVLFDYEFLVRVEATELSVDMARLLAVPHTLEQPRVRLSANGRDFLSRYGE